MKNKHILGRIIIFLVLILTPILTNGQTQANIKISEEKVSHDGKFFYLHTVKKGQTLYSISKAYQVAVETIVSENIDAANRIYEGDSLKIPFENNVLFPSQNIKHSNTIDKPDSMIIDDENIVKIFDNLNVDFANTDYLEGSIDVALFLPLFLKENSRQNLQDSLNINKSNKRKPKKNSKPGGWIFPRSINFIEFYEGVLIALDDLRSKGLSINMSTYDTRGNPRIVEKILNKEDFSNTDLIIGPVYSANVELLSKFAIQARIPVVSPLANRSNDVLSNNPYLFKVQSNQDLLEEAMARKISEYSHYNIVLVYNDTIKGNKFYPNLKNRIYKKLRYKAVNEDISLRELVFSSMSTRRKDSTNPLEYALSKDRPNLVILATTNNAFMSEVIAKSNSFLRSFTIEIFGYPELRWIDNLDPIYLYNLNAMLYTPNWIDYEDYDVKLFLKKYRKMFSMEPQQKSYAWLAYDIANYFISGIAIHGSQFKYNPQAHKQKLLQQKFNFSRNDVFSGFENKNLVFIHYTPLKTLEFPDEHK